MAWLPRRQAPGCRCRSEPLPPLRPGPRTPPHPPAGEAPCMLTIFVTNYWQLFTLRLLTGIALGGAPARCQCLARWLANTMHMRRDRGGGAGAFVCVCVCVLGFLGGRGGRVHSSNHAVAPQRQESARELPCMHAQVCNNLTRHCREATMRSRPPAPTPSPLPPLPLHGRRPAHRIQPAWRPLRPLQPRRRQQHRAAEHWRGPGSGAGHRRLCG